MPFGALGVITDVVESTVPSVLEAKIAASFAAQLVAAPVSQLVEIALAGGGAGGVLQATIYYSTEEDGLFPPLDEQNIRVFFASDRKTMADQIAGFYATTDVDRTTFVEKVAQGDGIQWVDLIVYTLGVGLALLVADAPDVGAPSFVRGEPISFEGHRTVMARLRRRRVAEPKARRPVVLPKVAEPVTQPIAELSPAVPARSSIAAHKATIAKLRRRRRKG